MSTPPPNQSRPVDVWIDTDTAIGVPGADVDDALALIQAFHSPEICVRGVSAVFGNAPLDKTLPIAREVVRRFGPPGLEVYRGAACAAGLGSECDAVAALAAALRERRLTVLALGPLTNLGSLLRLHPELAPRIDEIVAVAARRPGQRFLSVPSQSTPFPDLNFDCDPAAMRILLESPVDLVFTPWEVSSHIWITGDDLDRLALGGASGAYLAAECRSWLAGWEKDLWAPGFNPFDSLAVAWATHPQLLQHFRARVWIAPGPDDSAAAGSRTTGATKPHLLVEALPEDAASRATYCFEPSAALKPILLERLAGPARQPDLAP